jgi:hypothetical protein
VPPVTAGRCRTDLDRAEDAVVDATEPALAANGVAHDVYDYDAEGRKYETSSAIFQTSLPSAIRSCCSSD